MSANDRRPCDGLVVDWGGVLTTSVFASFNAFCEAEGLAADAVGERFRGDPAARELLEQLERGTLEEAAFETRFAALLEVAHERLIDRMFGGVRLEPRMLAAVRAARAAGVRTGLLSNSWSARAYDAALLDELFDARVISGEHGMRKPEPEIYALAAERMRLAPERIVFVDDLPGNLKPARALGMHTVRHVDVESTFAELEPLLGLAL